MALNDFLSKLPLDVIKKTEILNNKVTIPTAINPNKFHKEFSAEISSPNFTTEKAVFVASRIKEQPANTPSSLLNARLVFFK